MSPCLWLLLAAAPHTVAVDLSALDRATYQELDAVSLERGLVVRLVQEGFAVVSSTASPEIRVRIARKGRVVELTAGDATAHVDVDVKHLREFHFEAAQKAAELARAAARTLDEKLQPEPEKPQPPPAPLLPPPEAPAPPPPPPPEPRWNVLAAGGVLLRAPGVDPRATIALRFAPTSRLGLHLEAALSPIPGTPLTVYDGALLLGVGVKLVQASIFRAELGLSLGAALHSFSLATLSADDRFGTRFDFVARPFLRLSLNPVSGLLIWAQGGAGLSTSAREHRLQGQTLYSRGAFWADLQGGLGWEL